MMRKKKALRQKQKKKEPSLAMLALKALREAVAEVRARHKRMGIPLAVWEDGKVVLIPPEQITVGDIDPLDGVLDGENQGGARRRRRNNRARPDGR